MLASIRENISRPLLFVGIGGAVLSLITIAVLFDHGCISGPWILIFILAYISCVAFSFDPHCWEVAVEIFPNVTGGKAMAVGTPSMWMDTFLVGQLRSFRFTYLGPSGSPFQN